MASRRQQRQPPPLPASLGGELYAARLARAELEAERSGDASDLLLVDELLRDFGRAWRAAGSAAWSPAVGAAAPALTSAPALSSQQAEALAVAHMRLLQASLVGTPCVPFICAGS